MVQSVGDLAAPMPLPHSLFGFGGGTIISADITSVVLDSKPCSKGFSPGSPIIRFIILRLQVCQSKD